MSGLIYALAIVGGVTVIFSLAVGFMLLGGWAVRLIDRRKRRGTATVVIHPDTTQFSEATKRAADAMRLMRGGLR